MLTFAAFTPHPPIIIPKIGKTNTKHCVKTIKAMNRLSKNIENCDVSSLIIISPHTSLHPQEMTISFNDSAYGDFTQFDEPNIRIKKEIDTVLAENIHKYSKNRNTFVIFIWHSTICCEPDGAQTTRKRLKKPLFRGALGLYP